MPHISVVIPFYFGADSFDLLIDRLHKSLKVVTNDFEIIVVDDRSPDNGWKRIKKSCEKHYFIKALKLSRNFGQHNAITAGLEHASGDWVVVMDCDLQDPPEKIKDLYKTAIEGFDIVCARRVNRKDNFLKKLSSRAFYSVFGYLTDTKQDPAVANFGIYSRKAIKAILSMKDKIRYFPTMIQWIGFRRTYLDIDHGARAVGVSSYNWKSLFYLAWNNIISFSDKPLRLTVKLGLFISLFSSFMGTFYLFQYICGLTTVSGFTSVIISVWFLSGIIIFILGMLGQYISKIFDNVKNRPLYIIDEMLNLPPDAN